MSIHTLDPTFRVPGFFTQENVNTISKLITLTIAQSYTDKKVIVPDPHIWRDMQRVQEERPESVARMNRRVVMNIVRGFLDFVQETQRANMWAHHRWDGYNFDPKLGIKQFETPKLRGNRVQRRDDRGFRFHFTF